MVRILHPIAHTCMAMLLVACANTNIAQREADDIYAAHALIEQLDGNYPVWLAVLADRAGEREMGGLSQRYAEEAIVALEMQGRIIQWNDHVESSLAHMIYYTCVRMARVDARLAVTDQPTDYLSRCIDRAHRYVVEEVAVSSEDERERDWDLLHSRLFELVRQFGFDDLAREIAIYAEESIIPHFDDSEMRYAGTIWVDHFAALLSEDVIRRQCQRVLENGRVHVDEDEEWFFPLYYSEFNCFSVLHEAVASEVREFGHAQRQAFSDPQSDPMKISWYFDLLYSQATSGWEFPIHFEDLAGSSCHSEEPISCLISNFMGSEALNAQLADGAGFYEERWVLGLHALAVLWGSEDGEQRTEAFARRTLRREFELDPPTENVLDVARYTDSYAAHVMGYVWEDFDQDRALEELRSLAPLHPTAETDSHANDFAFRLAGSFLEQDEPDRTIDVLDNIAAWDPELERRRWGPPEDLEEDEVRFVIPGWSAGDATFQAGVLYGQAGAITRSCEQLRRVWFPSPGPGGDLAVAQAQSLSGCFSDARDGYASVLDYVSALPSTTYYGFENEDPVALYRAWVAVSALPPIQGPEAIVPGFPYQSRGEFWYYGATVPY